MREPGMRRVRAARSPRRRPARCTTSLATPGPRRRSPASDAGTGGVQPWSPVQPSSPTSPPGRRPMPGGFYGHASAVAPAVSPPSPSASSPEAPGQSRPRARRPKTRTPFSARAHDPPGDPDGPWPPGPPHTSQTGASGADDAEVRSSRMGKPPRKTTRTPRTRRAISTASRSPPCRPRSRPAACRSYSCSSNAGCFLTDSLHRVDHDATDVGRDSHLGVNLGASPVLE